MTLTDRFLGRLGYAKRSFLPFTPEQLYAMQQGSMSLQYPQTTLNNKQEPIGAGFSSLVTYAYASNPVVFACVNARVQLFSEARFQFQRMPNGVPGELFNGPSTYLRPLQEPWPGGTTSLLLKDKLLDDTFAGNAFTRRTATGLERKRPDWVTIIAGSTRPDANTWDEDVVVLGYGYQPGGPEGGRPLEFYQASEIAHFKSTHDPMRRFSGMPWLMPVLKDLSADGAATSHKLKYFENAATPNAVVKFPETITKAQAADWSEMFHKDHEGAANAYKTVFLGGGADMTSIGDNMSKAAFTDVQGKGELRIASAAGVPPIIIGLAGGLDAATYSNYGQARRAFADLTMRPLWRDVAGALSNIITVPSESRLWFDDRDISFLQEDVKDAADIQSAQASTIRTLTDAGFDADTIIEAVTSGDFNRLKHTGLFSVQLQPPGTVQTAPEEAAPALPAGPQPAALLNSGQRSAEVRCTCGKLLAEIATAPYRLSCPRCKQVSEADRIAA